MTAASRPTPPDPDPDGDPAGGGCAPEPCPAAGRLTAGRLLAGLAVAGAAAAVLLGRPTARTSPRPPSRPAVVVAAARPSRVRPPPPGPTEVSRTFVAAYAAFVYGRRPAADLPGLTPALRRRIAALHPQPAPVVLGAADPRLRSLRLAVLRPGRARAVAVIDDRAAVYDIVLELRRRPAGWTITDLGETS